MQKKQIDPCIAVSIQYRRVTYQSDRQTDDDI